MAFSKERRKADGTLFYEIRAYNADKKTHYSRYYYPPRGWSKRAIEKALKDEVAEFQRAVDAGEVLSKTEKQAVKAAEAAEAAAREAERAMLKTVRQYAEKVFMPKKELSVAENTRLSYWSNLNEHIFPAFGDCLISNVSTAMINGMLSDFQKTHKYGSAVKLFNVCNGLFGMAFRDGTIAVNPMYRVERPAQKKDEKAVTEADKALREKELNHVLDCVSKEPLKWQAFIYLAADTGARRGELCGLQWADISYKKGVVTFRRNLQYSRDKGGIYECTPKGGKARSVDVGEETIAILKRWAAEQASSRLSKWVFTRDGEDAPMFPNTTPNWYFKKFGERYEIPGFHPHLLRHTSASLCLTNGADVKSVADRLGHSDASVTLRVYSHANDESIRKAGQAARDALKRSKAQDKEKAGA